MVVVMMIPVIVVIVIAVRAVMMMVMMPPTVTVMVIRSSVPDRLKPEVFLPARYVRCTLKSGRRQVSQQVRRASIPKPGERKVSRPYPEHRPRRPKQMPPANRLQTPKNRLTRKIGPI